jgi:hypothetical protein
VNNPKKEIKMKKDEVRTRVPKEWEPYFRRANVHVEELDACKSKQCRAIKIGRFLSPKVGREVPILIKGRAGKATLQVAVGRAKEKRYSFKVTWDDQVATVGVTKKSAPAKKKRTTTKKPKTAEPTPKAKIKPAAKVKKPAQGKPAKNPGKGNNEDW